MDFAMKGYLGHQDGIESDNEAVDNWNGFFKGGNGSLYTQKYNHKMLPRDMWVLTQEALKLAREKYPLFLSNLAGVAKDTKSLASRDRKIRILDYGCGEGRSFAFIEKIAPDLEKQGIEVELVAYDPAANGLQGFQEHLSNKQFETIENNGLKDVTTSCTEIGRRGYHASTMQKDNVTVKFIHSDIKDTTEHSKSLIGEVDMTMSMFGVLSFIPGKENRQDVMRMLNDITNPDGSVVLTLPSRLRFPINQKNHQLLREMQAPYKHAKEDGDIYYDRGELEFFYHLYNTRDFLEDLYAARLLPKGIEVDYMLDMKTLIDNPHLAKVDEYLSWLTPQSLVDSCASDVLAVSKPSRGRG